MRRPTLWILQLLLPLLQQMSAGLALESYEPPEPASGEPSNATLTVLSCCGTNEDLARPSPDGTVRCVPSDPLRLVIYSPDTGEFLSTIPSLWDVRYAARPACGESRVPRYLQKSISNPYILFESGLLVPELGSEIELETSEYCLGTSALLACMPLEEEVGMPADGSVVAKRPRVRKCCGENAAYEK